MLGNPTDQILTFANRVAEIVSEKYPDKTISILKLITTVSSRRKR